MTKPNFSVQINVPVFDGRDAIVGSRNVFVAGAETAGWAHRLAAKVNEEQGLALSEAWAYVFDRNGKIVFPSLPELRLPVRSVAADDCPF